MKIETYLKILKSIIWEFAPNYTIFDNLTTNGIYYRTTDTLCFVELPIFTQEFVDDFNKTHKEYIRKNK